MRSARSSAVSMSCSIITTVTSRGMRPIRSFIAARSSRERPASGSSSSSSFGFCASAMAISRRRFSPYATSAIGRRERCSRPTRFSTSRASSSTSV